MSLQDQLMKAGLVSKHDAKKANKDKHRARKAGKSVVNEAKAEAAQKRAEQAERDRQLNAERKAEAEKKALQAQIRQLITVNAQPRDKGDLAYNFSDQGSITKIYVTPALQQGLINGQLAIAKLGQEYFLIAAAVAEKVAQRDASAIVLLNDKASDQPDEDDPYADYQIPDDLMW
ncbi:Protein of unknown function DUF2058 [Ferrimonas balearica DSM 9799]|uniref:Nucleoprotein/polynucleotide-associated enzyme n=1 Tax=Ferrimonas balearica (strain DSM 9799 / CCM 4581 / KCTC 23876 / PAT) TaxID=550540 RepID=E1SVE1_FERBD|nr:DUF2058 domain-containing protein [Ferrimonas balearica]MBY6019320.1 DUF2058 domain-containing protein [Halomonas denitrificans]ADN74295.1 Protein of unknown function DUF2058 [Ferrimonas balearica DSM 9799]MBW3141289.1 DUF2058 domain-containing protein [Ferrimonas balearica]MBW3166148.1 DUF2058 domain-containing protein [Ferrimonas balearica]MBY5981936.1 DUF2058 domain-containing protein [Ferrimonas balearica]